MADPATIQHTKNVKQLTLEVLQAELGILAADAHIAAQILLSCPKDTVEARLDEVVTSFNKVHTRILALRQL